MCLEHVRTATTTQVLLTVFRAEQILRKECFPVAQSLGVHMPLMLSLASAALSPVTELARVGTLLGQGTVSFLAKHFSACGFSR